jgi:hypothetical protein
MKATSIPFSYVDGGHLISIPARVNELEPNRFIFDTGIGLNILFRAFSERMGFKYTGENFRGKRMSGQEISCDLVTIPSLSVPGVDRRDVTAGVIDMNLPAGLSDITGILSLEFLKDVLFAIDYGSESVDVFEGPDSNRLNGAEVPIVIREEGPSIDAFVELQLPNKRNIRVEVDSGSNELILNEPLMEELGVRKNDCVKIEGKDETGNRFTRYTSKLSGAIRLSSAESIGQEEPEVIFQKIIYDGMLGYSFLKRYTVSYDIAGSRMIFNRRI